MQPLGERLKMAQNLLALNLDEESDLTPSRDERAAELIADRLQERGGSSSLARISRDESELNGRIRVAQNRLKHLAHPPDRFVHDVSAEKSHLAVR